MLGGLCSQYSVRFLLSTQFLSSGLAQKLKPAEPGCAAFLEFEGAAFLEFEGCLSLSRPCIWSRRHGAVFSWNLRPKNSADRWTPGCPRLRSPSMRAPSSSRPGRRGRAGSPHWTGTRAEFCRAFAAHRVLEQVQDLATRGRRRYLRSVSDQIGTSVLSVCLATSFLVSLTPLELFFCFCCWSFSLSLCDVFLEARGCSPDRLQSPGRQAISLVSGKSAASDWPRRDKTRCDLSQVLLLWEVIDNRYTTIIPLIFLAAKKAAL